MGRDIPLHVVLRGNGPSAHVVCVEAITGAVAGSLAPKGVARLIGCMEQGNDYAAVVDSIEDGDCRVIVWRSATAS